MLNIRPQTLSVLLGIIFVVLLGMKISELVRSGSIIENELIAPESLSPAGVAALGAALAPCAQNPPFSSAEDKKALENTRQLFCADSNSEAQRDWIKKQSYIAEDFAAWRGRYLHHYSTILFPYRQIEAGYLGYALTSQYGLISLIPLFLIPSSAFVLYGALSLFLLLLFGTYFLYKYRQSRSEIAIIGGILILITLVTYVPAIRLAPGFAFIRYLPLVLLIALANLQLVRARYIYIFFAVILALLNSLQFNILFIAIGLVSYLLIAIYQKKWNGLKCYWLPASVALVAAWQATLYTSQAGAFTPSLFSSVGEGGRSYFYALEIFLFPVVCKLASHTTIFGRPPPGKLSFDNEEILALVSYGLCATYTLSFLRSPQHFAGFLVMATLSIFVLVRKYGKSRPAIALGFGLLLVVPIHYSYMSVGKKFFLQTSQLFEYKNKIGTPIFFKTALEIDEVYKDYDEIVKLSQPKGKTYFISKDKIFIEAYTNKNIEPAVYDIFTNYESINPKQALMRLKSEDVSYLVLDNSYQRKYSLGIAVQFKREIGSQENLAGQSILSNIDSLAIILSDNIVNCNVRYCLYRLKLI
jgi:hypothetical protein